MSRKHTCVLVGNSGPQDIILTTLNYSVKTIETY